MTSTLIAGIFSIAGLLIGSFITHLLNRKKNKLEIEKLKNEITQQKLDIELKRLEIIQSKLGSAEKIIHCPGRSPLMPHSPHSLRHTDAPIVQP